MKRSLIALALLAACEKSFEPASYVQGVRVLAIKAEPAEVAPGGTTTLTALAVDTNGGLLTATWEACTEPPLVGYGAINSACLSQDAAPFLVPLGTELSLAATLPLVAPSDFAPPDASGGLYLPIRVRVQSKNERVDAAFHLRLAQGGTPNHNPTLTGVLVIPAQGDPIPLDEATPFAVHAGDRITMRATFSEDSAESYTLMVPGNTQTVTELLRVSWFATAGSWTEEVTGLAKPNTVWRADVHFPPAGTTIDVYVVGRDERGGVDFLHRVLRSS